MRTIDIKGKPYVMVNDRLKAFRAEHPQWGIETNIIELTDSAVTMQVRIYNENKYCLSTGTAREEKDDRTSMVNKTSFVENCETSALGRALGILGYGIDESIASADEVARAIAKQDNSKAFEQEVKDDETRQDYKSEEITLEKARAYKTTKGTPFYALKDDQLQYIIDKSSNPIARKCAVLVLEDNKKMADDKLPDLKESGLPWD